MQNGIRKGEENQGEKGLQNTVESREERQPSYIQPMSPPYTEADATRSILGKASEMPTFPQAF